MSAVLEVCTTLHTFTCGHCSGVYAIAERYRAKREEEGNGWHCPYCQSKWGYFGKTEAQKLRDELTRKDAQLDQERARQRELRERIQQRDNVIRAERGAKTKLKKRIAAGVCPCCNRTFQDLARHMKGQHPEFAKAPTP
jgi:hypothetical protein